MSLTAGAGSLVFIPVIVYVLTDKELLPLLDVQRTKISVDRI